VSEQLGRSAQGGEAPKGRVDLIAVLYILGGIPAIVLYIVVCMVLARWIGFPA
jgi:hypothetical protein